MWPREGERLDTPTLNLIFIIMGTRMNISNESENPPQAIALAIVHDAHQQDDHIVAFCRNMNTVVDVVLFYLVDIWYGT